jgi:hypothetical protein
MTARLTMSELRERALVLATGRFLGWKIIGRNARATRRTRHQDREMTKYARIRIRAVRDYIKSKEATR